MRSPTRQCSVQVVSRLLDEMRQQELQPGVGVPGQGADVMNKDARVMPLQFLDEMRLQHFHPDVFTYNTLSTHTEVGSSTERALQPLMRCGSRDSCPM